MSPKDFNWTEDQQVTVINPTNEDFSWKVHGKEYRLGAGKKAKMPGFIAWLYVYNQAVKEVQEAGKFNSWNDEGFKQEYFEHYVAGIDALVQEVVEDEPDVNTFEEEEVEEDKVIDTEHDPEPNAGGNYVSKFEKKKIGRR